MSLLGLLSTLKTATLPDTLPAKSWPRPEDRHRGDTEAAPMWLGFMACMRSEGFAEDLFDTPLPGR